MANYPSGTTTTPMPTARSSFRVATVFAAIFVASAAAAQPQKLSLSEDPQVDVVATGLAVPASRDQERALEEALERYRGIAERGGWKPVSTDLVMGPGFSYDCRRVAALERRLVAEGYLDRVTPPPPAPVQPEEPPSRWRSKPVPPPRPPVDVRCEYGPKLTDAVRAFQSDRKVLGFGQLGAKTLAQLNRPVEEILNILEQDLARWRARSLQMPRSFLLVNVPFFELSVFEDGREVMRMPVVAGQTKTPTPLFSDEIEYLIINPDWGIPDSITKNEMRPAQKRDPNYFRWQGITDTGSGLRQKPGPRNPLGQIKFVLPNEHDVYLHDTPEKRAFLAASRALSHGCIRLSRPKDLANYLLRDEPSWDRRRLDASIASKKTSQVNLREHMPVFIVYSTSRVNEEGRVELRPDVYRKNRRATVFDRPEAPRPEDASLYHGP